jgi:hypothetical protein
MGIIDTLKADHAAAKDASADRDFMVLAFVLEQAAKIGKMDGNRPTTDAETLALIRKMHKETEVALATAVTNAAVTGDAALDLPMVTPLGIELMEHKVVQLATYIPAQMDQDELEAAIRGFCKNNMFATEVSIIAYLDANFPGQFSEADANSFASSYLAPKTTGATGPTGS